MSERESKRPEIPNRLRMTFKAETGALVFYIPKHGRWGVAASDETRALWKHIIELYDTTRSLNPEDND